MKFKCYQNWHQLPSNSDAIFANAVKESVFLSREWFESLDSHILNNDQELLLACVVNTAYQANGPENKIPQEPLLAILPLLKNKNGEWTSYCHSYSSLYSVLLADSRQQEILNCLCKGLIDLPFNYLTLAPIAEDDDKLLQLQKAMKAEGISCYRNHKAYNWFHRVHPQEHGHSFANYTMERPSKLRNTIARKQRKLEREHAYEIHLYTHTHSDSDAVFENSNEMEQALDDYHAIYNVSWKANEQHEALVKGVIERFAPRAWPRLAILKVEGKPIAAQLWFVVEGKASIFRLVYDEAWKQYSPGSILMNYLLEYVIDTDKVEEIDFLSGNDAYKKDWMSERRERYALVCVKNAETATKETKSLFSRAIQFLWK